MGRRIADSLHQSEMPATSQGELMEGMSYRGDEPIDLAQLRARLRKMRDDWLEAVGNSIK